MLVFEERGKPEYPEKNLSEQGENQHQTQPTYDAGTKNRTRATLVGGECSHHYTTPAPLLFICLTMESFSDVDQSDSVVRQMKSKSNSNSNS